MRRHGRAEPPPVKSVHEQEWLYEADTLVYDVAAVSRESVDPSMSKRHHQGDVPRTALRERY
jgi:hypothetical protein